MAKQKRPWRFLIEGVVVGFILAVILLVAVPRMLREQQRYASHHPDTSTTSITHTGDPFHIAIFGRGYFEFALPDGKVAYSRISEFKSEQGRLLSIHGYPISNIANGALNIRYSIWPDGFIYNQSGRSFKSDLQNSIPVFLFEDSGQLEDMGDGYYRPTAGSGKPIKVKPFAHTGGGILLQGWKLERTSHYGTPPHQMVNENHNGLRDYPNEAIIESDAANMYAIEGRGFAALLTPDGRLGYTRVLRLAQTPQGHVVRAFPPTKPYQKFTYAGELEKTDTASYPFLVGLPIVRKLIEDSSGPLAVRANPFAYAKPLSDQEEIISISMQYGVRRGHHPYAFQNQEGVWYALQTSPENGMKNVDDFTVLTNELGRPFLVPQAEYCLSLADIESIQLFDFDNPKALQYRLNGVYAPTDRSGPATLLSPQAAGKLKRGSINQVEALTP
ncbi:MAG: hypothetical protein P9L94_02500 [Candidatus Hinthialibacter antarcticus]|nr:hypothetical protein [Candidatus Hinthialibacter antarcticus]